MNWNLSLLKVLPLLTLTTGLLIPTNIAEAASSSPKESAIVNNDSHGGGHKIPVKVSQILLSKKAQKIEFFGLLGIIGVSVIIPEIREHPILAKRRKIEILNSRVYLAN